MRTPLLMLPLAVSALVGCTGTVPPQGDADAEASSTATGVVVVERTVSAGGESTRAEAVARFVRMRSGAVDDDALRMVGAAVDFPAFGTCAQLSSSRTPSSQTGGAPVRAIALVDVGAVTVETEGGRANLLPRRMPDVADVVSGVVYAARPGDTALPPRSRYTLRAAGSPDLDVAPFSVLANAPAEPSDLRIGGREARGAAIDIPAQTPIEVAWEPGASDDLVYIDVAGASGSAGAATVRCLFGDNGRALLPAAAFATVDDGTLAVHRLHRESFHAAGVDPGEVRFDFARVVAISRH